MPSGIGAEGISVGLGSQGKALLMAVLSTAEDGRRPLKALLVTERHFMKSYDGSAAIYRAWLNYLTGCGYDVSVLSFNQARVRWDRGSEEELRRQVKDLLIVDVCPNKAAAVLRQLASAAWRVVAGLRYLPTAVEGLFRSDQRSQIAKFLDAHDFDVVIVNKVVSTGLMGSANLARINGLRLIDVHDNNPLRSRLTRIAMLRLLHRVPREVARMTRIQEVGELLNWASMKRMMREEIRMLSGYDQVLFSSAEEAEAFRSAGLPPDRIRITPWPFENMVKDAAPQDGSESARPYHVGMVGSAGLFNLEGAVFLVDQVLPYLRERVPGLRVLIAGSVCKQVRPLLAGDPSVTLVPWVDRLEDFYRQVEVVVVPLLSGTGVSIKSLEAGWVGSAIVSTPMGVRGLDLAEGRDVLVAAGHGAFADAVVRLLDDPELRQTLRTNVARAIRARHSAASFAGAMASIFSVL